MSQVWSITQFYSVYLFAIKDQRNKSEFFTNMYSRFASVVLGSVLGPSHTRSTPEGVLVSLEFQKQGMGKVEGP